MDQASSLRNLMNKTQQVKTFPVAFCSTSDFLHPEEAVTAFGVAYSGRTQRKVTIFGLPAKNGQDSLAEAVVNGESAEGLTRRLSPKTLLVPGELGFISDIRHDTRLLKVAADALREAERNSDDLFYFAGRKFNAASVNLAKLAPKVVLLMRETPASFKEMADFIQVFAVTRANEGLGLLVETSQPKQFQEQAKKLQEMYWREFKYCIEPIGFFDQGNKREGAAPRFVIHAFDYLFQKNETKQLSESVEKLRV